MWKTIEWKVKRNCRCMFWTHGKGGLDVIVKSTHCKNCEEKKKKYEAHQKATVEYLTWCTEHEMKC